MAKLHYITTGNLQDSPIVFLHGFLGSAIDWNICTSALTDMFFCVSIDLPGHGQSINLDGALYSMAGCAAAVCEIIDELGMQCCNLVGYSMGGRLGLYLAVAHPDRFNSIVLESASPGLKTEVERKARRQADEQLARELEQKDFDLFLKRWYQQPLFQSLAADETALRKVVQQRWNNVPAELVRSLRGMGTGAQSSLWDKLHHLQNRLLIIVGEHDTKFQQIGQSMVELSSMAELVVVPAAGHNVHVENSVEYIRLIRTFFM
jgi:2-succinyl-6-hydroxy-2,4-cyclohexadiene-1-carboxylate synthase